jgi:chemotaxis signal transduction protein
VSDAVTSAKELNARLIELERLGREAAGEVATGVTRARSEVVLRIGERSFGVGIENVEAMLRDPAPVPVPGAPPWILGAVQAGPRMLAMLDPAWAAGASAQCASDEFPIALVLRLDTGSVAIGVEAIEGLARGPMSETRSRGGAALDLGALAERLHGAAG